MPGESSSGLAVVFACDRRYLPFALFLAWQIHQHCPDRSFDMLLASQEDLSLPGWASEAGLRALLVDLAPGVTGLRPMRSSHATYLRLMLPGVLAGRYRRLLYLDSDMSFLGGDLERLLRIDLGPHPIAAARDVLHLLDRHYHAQEHQRLGEPPRPYFNSGLMLIDTAAYNLAEVMRRCIDLGRERPDVMCYHDQSLLNGVLLGDFAELSPAWNWMSGHLYPPEDFNVPVRFQHFNGPVKPWDDPEGLFHRRVAGAYADFFAAFLPDELAGLTRPPRDPVRTKGRLSERLRWHLQGRRTFAAGLARFRDEWDIKR